MKRVEGLAGERLATAGVMAAVVDGEGTDRWPPTALPRSRAAVPTSDPGKRAFHRPRRDRRRRPDAPRRRRRSARPSLRAVHVPASRPAKAGPGTFLLFDDERAPARSPNRSNLQALLDVLPIGLALVDRDGRFLTMNEASARPPGSRGRTMPVYPGDLVVKEDKAAGRRRGPAQCARPRHVGRPCGPARPSAGRAGGADHRRPARARRCRGPAPAQGQ